MTDHPVKRRKKLIEVAIPLEAINAASAREKSIRHGHPSTLHLWWARRPLAAARAVIFCQMVDDPSAVPEEFPTEEDQENERLRLFALISELVTWENTTNEEVLNRARAEIRRSWKRCCADNAEHPEAAELFNPEKLPGFHDPFAGGGALPLEAQRLGLESYASDLNPVAVLINKAMIEIPPKFAGQPPVNPESRSNLNVRQWEGAQGLAEDVQHYGKWIFDEAKKRIGYLYPKIAITAEIIEGRIDLSSYAGRELTPIAWLWARTVKSPDPAFAHIHVPLISSFNICTKSGSEHYVEPIVTDSRYDFVVRRGKPSDSSRSSQGTKQGRGNFRCIMSGASITSEYIREEASANRLKERLMAVVAEGERSRVYLSPTEHQEEIALKAVPTWKPETEFTQQALGFRVGNYGMTKWSNLFTNRQLAGLSMLASLVCEAREVVAQDAFQSAKLLNAELASHGSEFAKEYADAVVTYLSFAVSKVADRNSALNTWASLREHVKNTFTRQALSMTWDFAECNILSQSSGNFFGGVETIRSALSSLGHGLGRSVNADAASQTISRGKFISTDPPYYDNIGYADLSDFFYVWLRRQLRDAYPDLFGTLGTPKQDELVATPCRHGGKSGAESFFLEGMTRAMSNIASNCHPSSLTTIYYAFKQAETSSDNQSASTGWQVFLQAIINSGFSIHGTWPLSTELARRVRGRDSNALATSVLIVCGKRNERSMSISRSEFRRRLGAELPTALRALEQSNIAPVDMAQAAIGPGMAIYSQVKDVLNPDDSPMSVREALIEINTSLDEYLSQEAGDLDPESRYALTIFESYGYSERDFGDAENLAKARNISVSGVAEAGILRSVAGKVKLLQRSELKCDWDPAKDKRLCIWEATQQLILRLEANGESAAASLLFQLKQISGHGDLANNCKALAYRLYDHCEKTKQAEEARAYNGLVIAWPELERLASSQSTETAVQASLI